jgi:hypothetical protein
MQVTLSVQFTEGQSESREDWALLIKMEKRLGDGAWKGIGLLIIAMMAICYVLKCTKTRFQCPERKSY